MALSVGSRSAGIQHVARTTKLGNLTHVTGGRPLQADWTRSGGGGQAGGAGTGSVAGSPPGNAGASGDPGTPGTPGALGT